MATHQSRGLIRRFIPYYRKYIHLLIFDLVCAVLTTGFELLFPLIVGEITDRAVTNAASITVAWLARLGMIYLALVLVDAGAHFFMQSGGHVMGAKIETDMRTNLFAHLQQLSFAYYNNTKVGQIMARITSDLFDVTEFAHHGPEEILISSIKITVSFIILIGINAPLTLLIFALLPVMLLTTIYFNRKMRDAFKACRYQVGEINAQTEDTLLGMRVVQSFANEDIENAKFDRSNGKFLDLKRVQYRFMAGFNSTNRFLNGMMTITVVIAGAYFLSLGRITAGEFAAFFLYINMLLGSIRQLVNFTEQFQRGVTGIERFFEIMDAPLEIRDRPDAQPLKDVKGNIRLENVTFKYADGDEREVLREVTLNVPAGQSVALVGPSGSGKTTLCNLIPRFYDVTGGRILIDGKDIRGLTLKSLRDHIGMVQQDVYLFSGSVKENITYGKPNASMEDVIAAARKAGAHGFIMELPEGYDTYVGERGVKLSGGQKQRISIARVFLKNPPILLLDEATSALDNENERLVQKSLEELARGRTTLTIAHRLTTIRGADVIWVLTEKGLEEHGSHEELIAKKGLYHQLYQMYALNAMNK